VVVDDYGGVVVKLDSGTVFAADFFLAADDYGLNYALFLDVAVWRGLLDGGHDGITDAGVTAAGTAKHADTKDLLGAAVVGYGQPTFLLYHYCLSSVAFLPLLALAEAVFS